MELHEQIKIARERLGWNTTTLAHKMGVSKTAADNWEKGTQPHGKRFAKLQKVLGVPLYAGGTPAKPGLANTTSRLKNSA